MNESMRSRARWARAVLAVAMAAVMTLASPATNAKCERTGKSIAESARKFHPGHYVSIAKLTAAKGVRTVKEPGVTGVQLRYRWSELEPREGSYDFDVIGRDLESARRSGLQLVAMIEDKSFDRRMPTPPDLAGQTVPTRNRGFTAIRWDPKVEQRFTRLLAALGDRFDCDPNFEGIALQESAPSLDPTTLLQTNYTPEKYRDVLQRTLESASASFPTSRIFWYMNYLPGGQQYIADIARASVGSGVVMGGPDVLPESATLSRRVYPLYQEFKGRLKLFGAMQFDSFRHRRSGGPASDGSSYWSMDDMYAFARDKLHVDYLFWDYRPGGDPKGGRSWNDASKVIAAHPTLK